MIRPWLAYPLALHLLWLLPALGVLGAVAGRWRRRALGTVGPLAAAGAGDARGQRLRPFRSFCWFLGFVLLAVAVSGPRWGRQHESALASGRDLVVVLDLSRSMLACDVLPSRLEHAKEALLDLTQHVERRGGHRLALVVFAARPRVACPLTHDYDHFRAAVLSQDGAEPHPEIRAQADGPLSGTRMGAALALAAETHDPRYRGAQDILLLSDGDDPARDGEWRAGAEAARKLGIPIHAVGVGDPENLSPVPGRGDEPLLYEGKPVQTRLEEAELREIALHTRGTYTPARTQTLRLGELFHAHIEPAGDREGEDEAVTIYRPRQAWFFAAGLALLTLEMLLGRRARGAKSAPSVRPSLAFALCACCLVSAAPLAPGGRGVGGEGFAPSPSPQPLSPQGRGAFRSDSPWEDLLRRAEDAFARGAYEQAVALSTQAEERGTDPGLVAFNKAAALYRLGLAAEGEARHALFRQAAQHYWLTLEDAAGRRRARALYDLGNALMQQARHADAPLLEGAIDAYALCLREPATDDALRQDAQFNLELAKALWLRARAARHQANPDADPTEPDAGSPERKHDPPTVGPQAGLPKDVRVKGRPAPGKGGDPAQGSAATEEPGPAGKGQVPPLPDDDELARLSPEESAAHLREAAERIERERADYRRRTLVPPSRKVKDW